MKLSFDCDKGSATKAAFGLILLSVDETIESEFRPLFHQEGVSLLHARIESSSEVTSEKLMQMKARLTDTAALLPGTRPLDVIAYACTSDATVISSDQVAGAVQVVYPGARVTEPGPRSACSLHAAWRLADHHCLTLCGGGFRCAQPSSGKKRRDARKGRFLWPGARGSGCKDQSSVR